MRIFVRIAISKKSGKKYSAIVADLGYAERQIGFINDYLGAELLGITNAQYGALGVGEYDIK